MSILVSAHQLSKAFAARPLFQGVTFSISAGERIGLIGPNGAGKSTLLKILASKTSPDSGSLSLQRGVRVGYLEQVPGFASSATIRSSILEGTKALPDLADWERDLLVEELISKLDLARFEGGSETRVEKLSGGWKKRVALARELARKPDLLLLDEPTNHLDVESIVWLEELLASARFASLTITHDRAFLQKASNRIFELDPRNPEGILCVDGDYATYLEIKEQRMAAQERREVVLKNTLRRETEWLRRGAKARTTKQQARIQRALDLGDEVADLASRNLTRGVKIDFQGAEKNPKRLIDAKKISKSFADQKIFTNLSLVMTPGTRLGLLGPNGCGKSTLIRVLLGNDSPDSGEIHRSEHLQVAYFEQNRETLDPETTVAKTLCPIGEWVDYRGGRIHIRSYLDRFLFSPGHADMAVGKLSGGEQSRLLIARLMLKEANILVLDEPTNDLDLATLNVLEECLSEFSGAVILVTHDRYFLDQVANQILAFDPGQPGTLTSFADLSQWESWKEQRALEQKEKLARDQAALTRQKASESQSQAAPAATSTSSANAAKKRKLSYKEQREFDSMEETIQKTEARLAALTEESQSPTVATNAVRLAELTQEMSALQTEIERLYARWAELDS